MNLFDVEDTTVIRGISPGSFLDAKASFYREN